MSNITLLANLEFARLLSEASQDLQTSAGQSLFGKYQQFLLVNECNYSIVNNFLAESKNCMFDKAVTNLVESISNYIQTNKYSWQLASVCENIEKNSSSYNYLNKNACKQVSDLLENKTEEEVVKYIKAGALKNVMFVEQFRNVTKSIFKDTPLVESNTEYTTVTPISLVEQRDDKTYFEVAGNIYKLDESSISVATAKEVSNEFIVVSRLLESTDVSFANDTFTVKVNNDEYEVSKAGECTKRKATGEVSTLSTAQLREHNDMYMTAMGKYNKNSVRTAELLESVAKLTECFDRVSVLDNSRIISTKNDRFLVIENNGTVYSELLQSNHATKWSQNQDVVESIKFIKSRTNVDLNEHFKSQIAEVVEAKTAEEKEAILESIHNDEVQARKERIEKLTEQFKNDPVKLAMLSKLAQDLNEIK